MGQGASAASDLRHGGSTKQRQAKHRRSTRSLPDAALIRTIPANYQSGNRPIGVNPVDPPSSVGYQPNSRRVGITTNGCVGSGQNNVANHWDQEMMQKYMHRDAAPYYISTQAKPSNGPKSDISFNRPWGENGQRCQKSSKSRFDETSPGSSNWSDVASDMFRIARHRPSDSTAADRSISDVHSDFVPPVGADRHVRRHGRGSSKRCQQEKKIRRSEKQSERVIVGDRRQQRKETGEPDGSPLNGRHRFRDCVGFPMTPLPENPYKEHQECGKDREDEDKTDWPQRETVVIPKRSKSVHDCVSSKPSRLQPPSHPPPRPPKGKHYYARLENDSSNGAAPPENGRRLVEHWIDWPATAGADGSPSKSISTDTPTPRSPGSSECDKLVIQSLRAELSAERSLRVDAERRCKNYDKEIEPSRHRIRQLECDVQSLSEALDEIKQQREEEASSSKKKTDDLAERCRLLSEDLRRSTDEKRQAELRSDQEKSSYEDYMENVATQVGQALARQQTMKAECARLQKRVLEVEWENKVLKAQLRLTPMWTSSITGLISANGDHFPPRSSTGTFTPASSVASKSEFVPFVRQNVDHQNNNALTDVVYRKKSFRDKMAGLHKYRQSMGSDPTLEQSGGIADSSDAGLLSIDSLASFNEENEQFHNFAADSSVVSSCRLPSGSSPTRRLQEASGSQFLMLNAGEGLCSRPTSFTFDAASDFTGRPGLCQPNGPLSQISRYHFQNKAGQPSVMGRHYCYNYESNNNDEDDDDEEPVKNYAAMFGEEAALSSFSSSAAVMAPSVQGTSVSSGTPIFNAIIPANLGSNASQEIGQDSSTETLNEASNLRNGSSPKRKLDVVVNMLTNIQMRQPFPYSVWHPRNDNAEVKRKAQFGLPAAGLIRDDGYSTMSSELYAVFDSSILNRLKSSSSVLVPGADTVAKKMATSFPLYEKSGRSSSDGQLNEMTKLEQRIEKRNEASLNFDAFERDCMTLFGLPDEEVCGVNSKDDCNRFDWSNREALCDLDLDSAGVPELGDLKAITAFDYTGTIAMSDFDQFPPDPSISANVGQCEMVKATTNRRSREKSLDPKLKPTMKQGHQRARSSSNSDTSSTEGSDNIGAMVASDRRARHSAKFANASVSSTSTSFTSDDDDDGRMRVDESAKTTMGIWLKQLKIKRAGQKSGLVRYMPPENRPSILRPGVFARFGADERRALASFDFLHQVEEIRSPSLRKKSRSITDLYENLPYHERTGNGSETYFDRSRCSSRISATGGSLLTLTSASGADRALGAAKSYASSLFLSDFCNDDGDYSSSSSNSSLSFTLP